jgi:hypothetical protein
MRNDRMRYQYVWPARRPGSTYATTSASVCTTSEKFTPFIDRSML